MKIFYDSQSEKGHKDLTLVFDELELTEVADSYYFAIDNLFLPENESKDKVILVLKNLMDAWVKRVLMLLVNDVTFLPFDFSDQYLGCFRVEQINNKEISVCYGFTANVSGFEIPPSSIDNFLIMSDEEFEVTSHAVEFDKHIFVSSIKQSLLIE